MLIVLEGVDGAGKSTLTERLCDTLGPGALRLHSGPLESDPLREYEWRLKDYVPGSGQHVVCDRWHVGELIYGPLYRGQSRLTEPMRRHVEMYLDRLGAHKLVVSGSITTILSRLTSRGEDYLQPNHLGMVWDFYNEYAYANGWGIVTSDELPSHVIGLARKKELEAARLNPFRSYVGPTHPRHLLLGVRRGQTRHNRPAYESCFVPYTDTSGHYLLEALNATSVQDVGMANAAEEDVASLWSTLGRPNVVALGADAERLARAVPHSTAYHPSYVKRFQNKNLKAYSQQIKELLT